MSRKDVSIQLVEEIKSCNDLRAIEELLGAGADPSFKVRGKSLLTLAIDRDYFELEVVVLLLNAGAVANGDDLVNALYKTEIFDLLLNHGCDINAQARNGKTVLHASIGSWISEPREVYDAEVPDVQILESLISIGANPLIRDESGLLALDYAFMRGEEGEISLLIHETNSRRAAIDQQDCDGKTKLIRAAEKADLDEIKHIVADGANLNILDRRQHSALSWAIKEGHQAIAEYLVDHGAEYSNKIKTSTAAQLLKAVKHGYLGNVWQALKNGLPPPHVKEIVDFNQSRFIPLLLQYGAGTLGVEKTKYGCPVHVLQELLPRLLKNPEHIDLGDSWRDFQKRANEIVALTKSVSEKFSDDPWMESNMHACQCVERAGPAWNLRLLTVPVAMADRRKSMLSGPFFTSAEYPWPMDSNGAFASPVVQIDLEVVSQLSGEPFGDGMLQVWDAGPYQIFRNEPASWIRVIPRNIIESSTLTPVAPKSADDLLSNSTPSDWLHDGYVDHIIGYEGPVFSCYTDEEEAPIYSPPEIKALAKLFAGMSQNHSTFHLFGAFRSVQYSLVQRGDVFLALESALGYGWGDAGNAQIFYEITDSGPEFTFEWSCY